MTRKIFALAICTIFTTLSSLAQTPPDNEVWYTTTDGKKAELDEGNDNGNFKIISHTYANGKGVVRANRAIEDYGRWEGEGEDFGFKIIGNHIETITLPNRLTEIGWYAFEGCTSLTSITIPNSVTQIGGNAFLGCTSLKSFNGKYASADGRCLIKDGVLLAFAPAGLTSYTIPYGVTKIEDGFDGCTSLKSINIPNSVTEIREWAFYGCTSLTSITIPDSVTEIGWDAFMGCTSLTNITIPDSVTQIEPYAFHGCTSLTSITIPDSVTWIGWGAFEGCTSLKSFKGKFASADGRYLIKDAELIAFAPAGLTSYTIPYGVTKIGGVAFLGCTSLKSVNIPNSVTEIGTNAFSDCTSLTNINIPNSVTKIGRYAFSGCTSLTSINIPNSVTEIEWDAFSGCISLTSINIPNSVTGIGYDAFSGCKSLKSFKGKYASADGKCLIVDGELIAFAPAGLTSYTIPYGVTEIGGGGYIGGGAFRGCTSMKSITIPDSVTKIEDYAFEGCTSLTSITIPDSVTEIGDYAFSGCTSLTNITIHDSVTKIGYSAFSKCISLTNITIPDSVTEIGGYAFYGCTSLESFNGKYASADGRCLIKDSVLLASAPAGLTSYTIPDSVTEIGSCAFWGCTSLTNINISNSVTEIGDNAFDGCTSLKSINIPNSVTKIGYSAFRGCTSLTSITIPDSVTKIEGGAFSDCTSLTSITIPDSITEIRWGAFEGCTSLTSVNIPNSVTKIEGGAFSDCTGLTSITIPDSVTEIGEWAFSDCTSLTSINIPNSVTEIREWAFSDCTSLTSINIPNSVTEIGYEAFKNCTNLTSITIPNSGIGIEYNEFEGCNIKQITINAVTGNIFQGYDGLDPSKVVAYTGKYASEDGRCLIKDGVLIDYIHNGAERYEIPNGVTIISDEVFKGCSSLKSITIPDSVTEIGYSAFRGCTNLTSITIPNIGIEIEYNAFEGCNIKQITINAVTGNIFRGCDGLAPSKVVAYTGKYASEDSRCLIKDGVFIDIIHTGLTSYVIPENITTIGKGVFKGCSTLKEITIPNSVTMIGEGAFYGCNIERITINAVTGNIFRGCNGLDPSKVVAYTGKYASEDGRCLIKDGVLIDYIHNGAERYQIPNGVTIISDGVFRGCSSLTSITCLATTPPQITTLGISEEAVIYVPKESVKLYKKAEGWEVYKKQIKRIKE